MRILAGEIAAAQATDMADAEAQVSDKLAEIVASDADE
jgi:hypothetical protein